MNGSSSFRVKISEKKKKIEKYFFVKKNSVNDLEPDPDPFFSSADPGSGSASKLNGSYALLETKCGEKRLFEEKINDFKTSVFYFL